MVILWSLVKRWNTTQESHRTTWARRLRWAKWRTSSRFWPCLTKPPVNNLLLMTCRQTKCPTPKCKLRIFRPSHSQLPYNKKLLSQLLHNKKLPSQLPPHRRCLLRKPKTRQPAVRPLRQPQVSLTTTMSRKKQNDPTV